MEKDFKRLKKMNKLESRSSILVDLANNRYSYL